MAKARTRTRAAVDMSPEAIDRRLRELGQLYELGMEIRSARWLGTLKELEQRAARSGSPPTSREDRKT